MGSVGPWLLFFVGFITAAASYDFPFQYNPMSYGQPMGEGAFEEGAFGEGTIGEGTIGEEAVGAQGPGGKNLLKNNEKCPAKDGRCKSHHCSLKTERSKGQAYCLPFFKNGVQCNRNYNCISKNCVMKPASNKKGKKGICRPKKSQKPDSGDVAYVGKDCKFINDCCKSGKDCDVNFDVGCFPFYKGKCTKLPQLNEPCTLPGEQCSVKNGLECDRRSLPVPLVCKATFSSPPNTCRVGKTMFENLDCLSSERFCRDFGKKTTEDGVYGRTCKGCVYSEDTGCIKGIYPCCANEVCDNAIPTVTTGKCLEGTREEIIIE